MGTTAGPAVQEQTRRSALPARVSRWALESENPERGSSAGPCAHMTETEETTGWKAPDCFGLFKL